MLQEFNFFLNRSQYIPEWILDSLYTPKHECINIKSSNLKIYIYILKKSYNLIFGNFIKTYSIQNQYTYLFLFYKYTIYLKYWI